MTSVSPSMLTTAAHAIASGTSTVAHVAETIAPAASAVAHDAAPAASAAVAQAREGQRLVIAVLGERANPSVHNISRELQLLGAEAPIIDLKDVSFATPGLRRPGMSDLLLSGQPMPHLDGAVAYHGAMVPTQGLPKMRAMERSGVTFVNPPASITTSRDKWLAADAMQTAGVATPPTVLLADGPDVERAVLELGSPTVFKLRVGTEGRGVFKVTDPSEARPIAETVFATGHNLVAQKMVKMERPSDVRAFVVGDEVVAAMERIAPDRAGGLTDFRTNVSNGGAARAIAQMHPDDAATAVAAAKSMKLDVSGVDLMGDPGKMVVIEANSGPGQKISEITGTNVAAAIADLAVTKVQAAVASTAQAAGVAR